MKNYNGENDVYQGAYTVPGYEGVTPKPITKQGRGLEIATLVFGILALFVCCCDGILGGIGLVLGIIALVKGKRSGMTIAGVLCSALGILGAVVMVVFSMTGYGQELQEAFWEGFKEGAGMSINKGIDIGEEWTDEANGYTKNSVVSRQGTKSISDKSAGRIVIDGENIQVPCKLSTILELYEVGEFSKEYMEDGLDSGESITIFLAKNSEESGVCVEVKNTSKKTVDVRDGKVTMISFESNPEKDIEVLGGLTLGMTASQVEEVIENLNYNKSEMSGLVFYNVYPNNNSAYSVSVMLTEGIVSNITLYYSN